MLMQFSFRNFRSYKNETVFDFEASQADEMEDTLIVDAKDGKRFLPVSVIYGPNGGGKSNLLRAFICLTSTIVSPIVAMKKNIMPINSMYCENSQPFSFDAASKENPIEFEVYFRVEEMDYRYSLSLKDGIIIDESLYRRIVGGKRPALLYSREETTIEMGTSLLKYKVSQTMNEKMPFLSFLAITYNIPEIDVVAGWFESCILLNYASPIAEFVMGIVRKERDKNIMLSVLHDIDSGIIDYKPIFDEDQKLKDILVIRNIEGKSYSLSLQDESDGTQKMFRLLPLFIDSLSGGKLLVVDEMDAKLHPTLLRYLISLYNDPDINQKGAQLWFSSHDLTTMKNDVFRRDEIWFAYRDTEESSAIYSLYDLRTTKNAHIDTKSAYDKQYLEGRYGADPYFKRIMEWGE